MALATLLSLPFPSSSVSNQIVMYRLGPIIGFASLTALLPTQAFPCTCAPLPLPKALEKAHVVVRGVITQMEVLDTGRIRTHVQVREGFKNAATLGRITFYGPKFGASCFAFDFKVGREYLIFTARADSAQITGVPAGADVVALCGGTAERGSPLFNRTMPALRKLKIAPGRRQ